MIFQHIPAGKSHNRDILRIIPELSHHNILLKSRRRSKIGHRTGAVPAEKLFHPFQSQHSMLQKIYIMAVNLPGDQVRLRLPEIPVDPAVRSHIKPGRQHIENVAETHKGDHVSPVFLHRRPLSGIPVQYKENPLPFLLFQILHTVPEKVKTVVLGRRRIFLKHHPDTFLIPQRPQDAVQTKGKKFFQPGARAVVLRCRTAPQDQPVSRTSHGKENPPFSPVFIISQDQTHPEASSKNDRMQRCRACLILRRSGISLRFRQTGRGKRNQNAPVRMVCIHLSNIQLRLNGVLPLMRAAKRKQRPLLHRRIQLLSDKIYPGVFQIFAGTQNQMETGFIYFYAGRVNWLHV